MPQQGSDQEQAGQHQTSLSNADPSGARGRAGGNKKPASSMEYQLKEYLLLLATLVATVTYAAGLNLPGGVWPEDTHGGPHVAGDPILPDTHYRRYLAFYYCNAMAFVASLVACLLLVFLDEEETSWATVLRVVMVLDMFGLMGAYAAGSCRDLFTTIYSSLLVSAVFAYITHVFVTYTFWRVRVLTNRTQGKGDPKKQDVEEHDAKGDQEKQDKEKVQGDPEKQDKEEEHDANRSGEEHDVLMLLATFVVTITYVAGLGPPGGFWGSTQDGHRVSDPIMQEHYSARYQAFFVCNTTAFVASLLIIVLLMNKELSEAMTAANKTFSTRFVALYGFIAVALTGLVGAYAAGSCREPDATIYVVCLAGAVLAYIFLQVAMEKKRKKKKAMEKEYCVHNPSGWLTKIYGMFNSGAQQDDKLLEKNRSLVMLLATLVVSITYAAGLDPPGGLWPDDRDGHKGGDPVLLTIDPTRYKVFFYSNSAAFVTSLVVIIMVRSRFLLRRHILHAAMILDLFGLITAYAAGSSRDLTTSIYAVALAGIVLVYVVIHIVFFTLEDNMEHPEDADKLAKLDKRREMLLLLAILAATLTYQAGLTPPGGFWSADDKFGHHAGFPVFLDNYPRRYSAFFYCNAASFMASVTLIVLLVNPTLYKPGIKCYALYVCTVVGMFGLMGAYAAGSSRHLRTSIYMFILVAAVFAFLTIQVVIFWIRNHKGRPTSAPVNVSPGREGITGESSEVVIFRIQNYKGRPTSPVNVSSRQEGSTSESSEKVDKTLREYLMPIGVLAASVTYQTGLKPPGGLWQDNNNGHTAGNSILHDIDRGRYRAFFYSNSTSFMASIVIIVLLLPWNGLKLPLGPMYAAILLDMLGLLGAYAAGSTREWETSSLVIALIVPVLAYIAAYAAVTLLRNRNKG